jgi:hypothetical protein
MEKLSLEEKATNYDTMRHIERVRNLINFVVKDMLERAELHDQTKLKSPEVELFTEFTAKLANTTFGSDEYNKHKKEMKVALDHHYAHNRHHPEHHKNGVDDMTLLDLIEMLVDWKAASERHNDGNILKSIEHNGHRFDMSNQLIKIFENTAKELFIGV